MSVKGVKNQYVSSENKYFFSENKLPHTCIDHSRSDKRNCEKQSNEANCSFFKVR